MAGERLFMCAAVTLVVGGGAAMAGHNDRENYLNAALAQASVDANKISPAPDPDKLSKAFNDRNQFFEDIGQATRVGKLNSHFENSPFLAFNPEKVRELSSKPEVLEAGVLIDQQRDYESMLDKIKKEGNLDLREMADDLLRTGGLAIGFGGAVGLVVAGMLTREGRRPKSITV